MKVNLKIATAAALLNVVFVAAITASTGITQFVSNLIPAFIIFAFFVIWWNPFHVINVYIFRSWTALLLPRFYILRRSRRWP